MRASQPFKLPNSSALASLQFAARLGTAVLIIFALYAAKAVLIPFALSVLFAFLLSPAVNWLQRRGLSHAISIAIVASLVLLIVVGAGLLVWTSVSEFASNFPKYRDELTAKVQSVNQHLSNYTEKIEEFVSGKTSTNETQGGEDPGKSSNDASSQKISWQSWAGGAGAIVSPLGTAGLVLVFALFLLINRDDLRDRFVAVISRGNYLVTNEAIDEAADRISRYLVAQLILNASYGGVFGLGLFLIGRFLSPETGFPNVLFLGAMAGLVRFVPYVGPFIGAGLPLAVSIAVFPGYTVFFAVLGLIVTLELLSNNVVEPWLYGSSTGVSPIAVISAAVFWGWLWGAVGLLLATPLTVCLVVLGRHVPSLRFFATLLSDEQQIKPDQRLYQRLIADEPHKLEEVLREEARQREPLAFIDEVLVPTTKRILRMPEQDELSDLELTKRLSEILLDEAITKMLSEKRKETLADETSKRSIVCCAIPARHPAERLILETLRRTLQPDIELRLLETHDVPEMQAKSIVETNPEAIIIMSLPKAGLRQTRFWCETIRKQGYQGPVTVIRPGQFRDYDRLLISLRRAGATAVTTSVAQTARRLKSIASQRPAAVS
jgi:predicted PurR-regulated permease PerM